MNENSKKTKFRFECRRCIICVIGAVIYAVGINLFVTPAGLYSGGLMGICQLLRTLMSKYLGLNFGELDIAGIIYYIMNIPIFLIAIPKMEKLFFFKTFLSVTAMTVAMSLIPTVPVLSDTMTACIVGAVISGGGCGILLRMSGSSGGMDMIGIVLSKRGGNVSVGKVNLAVNLVLYTICLFMFDVQVAIYSMLYSVLYSFVMDKVHVQNINAEVKIITKVDPAEMEQQIFTKIGRGVTELHSVGAYTKQESHILYVLLSKYELPMLRSVVHATDPGAMVVVNEGIQVTDGNFMKKL